MIPTVEKNVPIPAHREGKNISLISRLEVGDSVFFPASDTVNVLNKYYNVARRLGMKITVRKMDDGIRMWRVS